MTPVSILAINGFGHLADLPCFKLKYAGASAVVSLYGGQVLSYKPKPDQETLWLSNLATWHNQQPIRGGIPICWPWFGPIAPQLMPQPQNSQQLELQPQFTNHGLVRNRLWQLEQQHCEQSGAQIQLSISVNDLPYYPGTIKLFLTITLNDTLRIRLNCDEDILQQAALHSYFKIRKLEQCKISPLPSQYQDSLSQQLVNTSSNTLQIDQEVDRIYHHTEPDIQLQKDRHSILISQEDHDATVVWNPWQEKCALLKDAKPRDYLNFVCIETARLALVAKPLALSQTISCP
ncbi:D-hexose-6-phosphate mutarotase [Rheinheimera salexigens]|uniref:Putative glucose-6-phosphate 1-epimerase n=1 Tax=Rheinheimera salexigens TaxID=1628148 RepID=A0A1E7Q6D4_9GAMM|nr:D-hexose-6-phosphate mutarotase [Rheinheimera salexigens]OEY69754.1 hypothetical protein BI198_09395 [Rheinheimera salexigens]